MTDLAKAKSFVGAGMLSMSCPMARSLTLQEINLAKGLNSVLDLYSDLI
jgi:hypothetical protein